MLSQLDTLSRYFQQIRLSPEDWPLHVVAAVAGAEALEKWPRFPPGATLAQQRLGHGGGEDVATATTRAVGELVEIASCCAWGDEVMTTARRSDLNGLSFGPGELSGFSGEQTANRDVWNTRLAGLDWIPRTADAATPIDWMRAECLFTGQAIFVPADCVLIGRRSAGDVAACAVADTNGCAAGQTPEDACLRALFELVERDATGRWWYGQKQALILDQAAFIIDTAIIDCLARRKRHLLLLDLTTDIGIPTVAALAMTAMGERLGVGFATRDNLQASVHAATTELMQMELRVMAAHFAQSPDTDLRRWFQEVRFEGIVPFKENPMDETPTGAGSDINLDACIERLKSAGCRVAIMNFTRPEFAVPVVRAISPDLCHWKPRFGRTRLLAREEIGRLGGDVLMDELNPRLMRI
jgi:ribosomal protein S12 methylthiotransferase accessory factor